MVTAVIVLFIVAVALGGFIAFDIVRGRKHIPIANAQSAESESQTAEEDAPQSSEERAAEPAPEPPVEQQPEPEKAPDPAVMEPREVRESITAIEVDNIMSDEVAESMIEKADGKVDRTKKGIINIDTLSQCFDSGEIVTLDEIKKRVKGFNQKTTYIKVLARGTLDKALTVEADSFSIQAVKMIVLTGGKAKMRA